MSSLESYNRRVKAIQWELYKAAYGSARRIPSQLILLRSPNQKKAIDAAGELWASLCHQQAFISSAALPALPFLAENLEHACETLAAEILDIFYGFALCSEPHAYTQAATLGYRKLMLSQAQMNEFRKLLKVHLPQLKQMGSSSNSELADLANDTISVLTRNS